jgi:hypothetical protein
VCVQVLLFFFLFVGGLWLYHAYLACTNQTTYEASFRDRVPYLKNLPEHTWPFSHGVASNLREFFLRRAPVAYRLKSVERLEEEEAAALEVCGRCGCC